MTGIIAMMTMRVRTETREIRRAGEKLRIGKERRIEWSDVVLGLAGAAASRKSAWSGANIQMVN
jgi:hypothetical protein